MAELACDQAATVWDATSWELASFRLGCLAFALLAAACGGGGGGGASGIPGQELAKPDGGTFFVDPNQGGRATRLHLVETSWARLVDVHDVDEGERVNPEPIFRAFAIDENVRSDALDYRLETSPITQKTRLIVLRRRGAPDGGRGTFESLLRAAAAALPPVVPRPDDSASTGPYSYVARNATLVLRFDDVLDDDLEARRDLIETVRVRTGYPPELPFLARLFFDPNHGALVGGAFHSTRVLIDLTVSATESASMLVPQPLNALGLPASLASTAAANVSVRLPTRPDPGSGQFQVLRGLSGAALATRENGPVDLSAPTQDVVRALRSGNATDADHGFLLDLRAPEILGSWNLRIDAVRDDPAGRPGFDYLVDAEFTSACQSAPLAGDVLSIGDAFLEVVPPGGALEGDGRVRGLRVRNPSDRAVANGRGLTGDALFLSTWQATDPAPPGCWIGLLPAPQSPPASGVSSSARVTVRFSEPMDPGSISAFDGLQVARGDALTPANATTLVVGEVSPSADLREFTFRPALPLAHEADVAETYHVRIEGATDLAGNAVATPAGMDFHLAAAQPRARNGSSVLRFGGNDELEPFGAPDLRGQCFYDRERGVIRPRPTAYASYPVDRINPVPSIMIPFAPGVQTPLSPLGSKLQAVWRYCDLGWQVLDETKYDLDVFGLSWAPKNGRVVDDFFESFEIRLAHSRRMPDEKLDVGNIPRFMGSGLLLHFQGNILEDPLSPQKVVHPRHLGYRISAADLFLASSGTVMLPFPLNRGHDAPSTYTWRDTAVLARGGPGAAGIPLGVEAGYPLYLEPEGKFGYVALRNEVPSFGLPLLIEYRCFPSSRGLGLNPLDVSLAINSSALPAFRVYSTGGIDQSGITVRRNPDEEPVGRGGFNPSSRPPGKPTAFPHDDAFYIGQLDVVTRLSRVHTVWIDTLFEAPDFVAPVILPRDADQPPSTRVVVECRGAHGFELGDIDALVGQDVDEGSFPFDARRLDPYGDVFAILPENKGSDSNPRYVDSYKALGSELFPGAVLYASGSPVWSADLDSFDGARYLQLRITFEGDIRGDGASPELSAIGLAWSER